MDTLFNCMEIIRVSCEYANPVYMCWMVDLDKANDHVPWGAAAVWRHEITNSYALSPLLIVIFKDGKSIKWTHKTACAWFLKKLSRAVIWHVIHLIRNQHYQTFCIRKLKCWQLTPNIMLCLYPKQRQHIQAREHGNDKAKMNISNMCTLQLLFEKIPMQTCWLTSWSSFWPSPLVPCFQ